MPITKSAKKAIRVAEKNKKVNDARRKNLKSAIKNFEKDLKAGVAKNSSTNLSLAYKAIDKAVKTGVLNKNTGSRRKSKLAKSLK